MDELPCHVQNGDLIGSLISWKSSTCVYKIGLRDPNLFLVAGEGSVFCKANIDWVVVEGSHTESETIAL